MNIEKQKALNRNIRIYWWNYGLRTLSFSGTYKEWFIKNEIIIRNYKNKVIFSGSFGNMKFRIFLSTDYEHSFNQIIKLCLMYLGDKAQLFDGFNREYKVNWR